jgi:hypothetical protein
MLHCLSRPLRHKAQKAVASWQKVGARGSLSQRAALGECPRNAAGAV